LLFWFSLAILSTSLRHRTQIHQGLTHSTVRTDKHSASLAGAYKLCHFLHSTACFSFALINGAMAKFVAKMTPGFVPYLLKASKLIDFLRKRGILSQIPVTFAT
jgi:hypothetical protein